MSSQERVPDAGSEPSLSMPSSDFTLPSSPTNRASQRIHNSDMTTDAPKAKISESTQTPVNPRMAAMLSKKSALQAKLGALQAERAALAAETKLPSGLSMPAGCSDEEKLKQALSSSNAIIKEHIALLHRYNEVKDIGQGLMGLIAESRGVRVGVVQEEFGLGEKD